MGVVFDRVPVKHSTMSLERANRWVLFGIVIALGAIVVLAALSGCAAPADNADSSADRTSEDVSSSEISSSSPETLSEEEESKAPSVSSVFASELPQVRLAAEGLDATITLEDSPAAQAFVELLPLELDMSDLNGNEKYVYLDASLPTDTYMPARIEAGDVMLYGENCIVVFYEPHDNATYSYTRLGRVDDPAVLASIAGASSVSLTFEAL